MSFVAAGVAIGGLAVSVYSVAHNEHKANVAAKQQQDLINNAPKYKISDEAYQNQAIAQSQAFGRDRSIQMQQENVSQEAQESGYEAKNVSNSTSSLLSTIAQINQNKNQALRGLGQDEAAIQNSKIQQLYGANNAMIDEKDKQFNYNSNQPYQAKIAALRDQIKYRQDSANAAAASAGSSIGQIGGMAASGSFSKGGGEGGI